MSILTESVRDQRKKVAEFEAALQLATATVPNGMSITTNTEPLAFLKSELAKAAADPNRHAKVLKSAQQALEASQAELDRLDAELLQVQAIALASSEKLPPLQGKVYEAFETLLSELKVLAAATQQANNDFRPLQKPDASFKFQPINAGFYGETHLIQSINSVAGYQFIENQRGLSK